jgi:hypothetical protein
MTRQADDCRYRIYRLRKGELQIMGTTDTAEGIGLALVTWHEEGEFGRRDTVGILDRPVPGRTGRWIVTPFREKRGAAQAP